MKILISVFHKVIYGESIVDAKLKNLRKKIHQTYDTAGLIQVGEYNERYEVKT